MRIGTRSHSQHTSRYPPPDRIFRLNVFCQNGPRRDNAVIRNVHALQNGDVRSQPHVIANNDVLIVLGEFLDIIKCHHWSIENVHAMITSYYGKVWTTHDVVANFYPGTRGQKCGTWPQIYVMAHRDIFGSGYLETSTQSYIFPTGGERVPEAGNEKALVNRPRNTVEQLKNAFHDYYFLHTILSTTPV